MKLLATAALLALALGAPAHAAGLKLPIPLPNPLAGATSAATKVTSQNVVSIGTALLNDFTASAAEAGPASAPVDPQGYACYSTVVSSLTGFASTKPDGIVSTGEAIWLLAQTAQKVASNTDCQAVCGRVQMLAGKVGGLLGSLAVPNVCGTFTSLAE